MARSQYKNIYYIRGVWQNLLKKKLNKKLSNKVIMGRQSTIPKILTGSKYFIYNGNTYNKVKLLSPMGGKKFGEFSVSKKPFYYPKKDKKKR